MNWKNGDVYVALHDSVDNVNDPIRQGEEWVVARLDEVGSDKVRFERVGVVNPKGKDVLILYRKNAEQVFKLKEDMKQRKFKVGDRVKIALTSKYYGNSSSNPAKVEGVITKTNSSKTLPLRVEWDNGRSNAYSSDDLVMADSVLEKADKLEIPVKFILAGYSEANAETKKLIRDAYPELFGNKKVDPEVLKAIYSGVCSDWKIKLYTKFPQTLSNIVEYKIGNKYTHDGGEYILAQPNSGEVALICLSSGNRWSDTVKCNINMNTISKVDFAKVAAGKPDQFKLIQ
jgi:hypothetical protein